jgi:hypothetical protein
MMSMGKKPMALILLILGAIMVSGCAGLTKQQMENINESRGLFNQATLAGAKKCAPCQYAKAEARSAIVFLLDVDEQVAFARKNDVPNLQYLTCRRNIYLQIASHLNIPTVDARQFSVFTD